MSSCPEHTVQDNSVPITPSVVLSPDDESAGSKARRKAERSLEDRELRKQLDPDHKMDKKQWGQALSEYRISRLPDDQLIDKLKNGKYAAFAASILEARGIDLSNYTITPRKPRVCQAPPPQPLETEVPDSSYYYLDGYRLVWPYPSVYKARAKLRWTDRPLREVLKEEFVAFHDGYIDHAIKHKRFLINGELASADHIFKQHDLFEHVVHRHEPPVKDDPVDVVIHRPELGLIVVNKPSSIPVHPCGKFFLNSVTNIIAKEGGWRHAHVVHRLDRATSGLLVMATDQQAAMRVSEQLRNRSLRKHYLARVRGRFPQTMGEAETLGAKVRLTNGRNGIGAICTDSNKSTLSVDDAYIPPLLGDWGSNDAVLLWDGVGVRTVESTKKNHEYLENSYNDDDLVRTGVDASCEIVVDRPVASTDLRYGLFGIGPAEPPAEISPESSASDWEKYNSLRYGPEGKAALTAFRFLSYDALTDTSLVHCMPRTGRTHQLRVHLMHLGHPIANDERYGGLRVPDWRHVRRACFDAAQITPDAECAALDLDNRHKNVDDPETRRGLWARAKDASCMHCIDVTAGIWADRFHFLKPDASASASASAAPEASRDPAAQQAQTYLPMGELASGASAASSGAAHGLTGVSFKEQCCNSGNATTADVEWDGNVPVREGQVAMDVFPDNIDIDPEREVIWLHALKYEAPDWTFDVPAPVWAAADSLTIPNMYYESQ